MPTVVSPVPTKVGVPSERKEALKSPAEGSPERKEIVERIIKGGSKKYAPVAPTPFNTPKETAKPETPTRELLKVVDISEQYKNMDKTTVLPEKEPKINIDTYSPDRKSVEVYTEFETVKTKETPEYTEYTTTATPYVIKRERSGTKVRDNKGLPEQFNETSEIKLNSGTGIYNPINKTYEPQVYKVKPVEENNLSTQILVGALEKSPTFLPRVASKLGEYIPDTSPKEVVVGEKKYYQSGTAAYQPDTKQYYITEPMTNEIKNVEYTAGSYNTMPLFLGTATAFGQYYIPVYGTTLLTTEATAGSYNIVEGIKTHNQGQATKGVFQVAPLVLYGAAKAVKYWTEPSIVIETDLYPRGSQITQTNKAGTIGLVKSGKTQFKGTWVLTESEAPDKLIEVTNRWRARFNKEPLSTTLILNKGTEDFTFGVVDSKGISGAITYSYNKEFPYYESGSMSYSKAQPVTLKKLMSNPDKSVMTKELIKQFGLNASDDLIFYESKGLDVTSGKVRDYKIFVAEKVPSYIDSSGKIIVADDLYRFKGISVGKEPGYDYQNILLKVTKDEKEVLTMLGKGKSTNQQWTDVLVNQELSKVDNSQLFKNVVITPDKPISDIPFYVGGEGSGTSLYYGGRTGFLGLNPSSTSTVITTETVQVNNLADVFANIPTISNTGTSFIKISGTSSPNVIGGFSSIFKDNTSGGNAIITGYEIIDRTKYEPVIKTEIVPKPFEGIKDNNANSFRNPIKSQFKQDTTPVQDIIQTPKEEQAFKEIVVQKPVLKRNIFTPPPRPTPRIPNIELPKLPKRSDIFSKVKQAFDVVTFRRGKEVKIAGGLPIGIAKKVGVREVLSNLRASFKLKPKGTTTIEDVDYKLPESFRLGKYDKLRFVQKKNTRFGTRSETSQAQFFRKAKKSKVRWL